MVDDMTNTKRQTNHTEAPATSAIIRQLLDIKGLVDISGSSVSFPVRGGVSGMVDVGLMIPLVGQRRTLVIRQDPKHVGFYRIRLYINRTSDVIDTISRVPAGLVYETCMDAVVLGSMDSF